MGRLLEALLPEGETQQCAAIPRELNKTIQGGRDDAIDRVAALPQESHLGRIDSRLYVDVGGLSTQS